MVWISPPSLRLVPLSIKQFSKLGRCSETLSPIGESGDLPRVLDAPPTVVCRSSRTHTPNLIVACMIDKRAKLGWKTDFPVSARNRIRSALVYISAALSAEWRVVIYKRTKIQIGRVNIDPQVGAKNSSVLTDAISMPYDLNLITNANNPCHRDGNAVNAFGVSNDS